jgi:hypothetical protein
MTMVQSVQTNVRDEERSSFSMYVFFNNKIFFSLFVFLMAHWRLLSEYPSYIKKDHILKTAGQAYIMRVHKSVHTHAHTELNVQLTG